MVINAAVPELPSSDSKDDTPSAGWQHQYLDLREGGLVDPDKDMYVDVEGLRDPVCNLTPGSEVKALVIGAGIHGITTAYRLVMDAGIKTEDLVVIDKAGGWGGTWYWNRYPGVMCDVEGYSYLPLLEESGHIPSQRYPAGFEIRSHMERTAKKFGLKADFGVTVKHLKWDEPTGRWNVTLTRSQPDSTQTEPFVIKSQWVTLSTGFLPNPQIPHLPGFARLRHAPGKSIMHTARWDWTISGGSQEKPDMVNFQGKRVGIIGTGPTAVQVVPHVAEWAGELLVFQRNPVYVGKHYQEETTPEMWEKVAYKRGWHVERMLNMDYWYAERPDRVDRVQDGWTEIPGLRGLTGTPLETIKPGEETSTMRKLLVRDYAWTAKMRQRVAREVDNPVIAEALQSHGPSFCKRPCFHNTYLSTFNRPNVTLVDTRGEGVTACTNNGIVANDQEYELDVLILATGYTSAVFDSCPTSGTKAPIIGRNGRSLQEKWNGDEFGVFFGLATNGFPNLFFFTPAGSGLSVNLTASLDTNARYIAFIMQQALQNSSDPASVVLEVSRDAEIEYTKQNAEKGRWFSGVASCRPGLMVNPDGTGVKVQSPEVEQLKRNPWGGGLLEFRKKFEDWMRSGKFQGFTVSSITHECGLSDENDSSLARKGEGQR